MHNYFMAIIMLAGIIAFIYLGKAFASKTMPSRFSSNKRIKVLEQLAVNTKERLVLLSVDNETILIGITPQNISTLHVVNKSCTKADLLIANRDENNDKSPSISDAMNINHAFVQSDKSLNRPKVK